jgi:hypothetical protein
MTSLKRKRLLIFALIAITFGEGSLGLINLLQGASVSHVLLIQGTQLVFFDALILSSLRKLKREQSS